LLSFFQKWKESKRSVSKRQLIKTKEAYMSAEEFKKSVDALLALRMSMLIPHVEAERAAKVLLADYLSDMLAVQQ